MLQVLFGIRSERQLVEQLRYSMLYRWFVGLPLHEQPWDHSPFAKIRDRRGQERSSFLPAFRL
jgi:transposase